MAAIRLINGKFQCVPAEFGATMWRIKNHEIAGNKKQQELAARIRQVFLNPANAPASYLTKFGSNDDWQKIPYLKKAEVGEIRLPYKD